jgi:hypothetical protein
MNPEQSQPEAPDAASTPAPPAPQSSPRPPSNQDNNFDFSLLSPAHQADLRFRLHAVHCWRSLTNSTPYGQRQAARRGLVESFRLAGRPVASKTLVEWFAAWRRDGLRGLVDYRWLFERKALPSAALLGAVGVVAPTWTLDFVIGLARRWHRRPGCFLRCYAETLAVAEGEGWPVCEPGAVKSYLREIGWAPAVRRRGAA